MEGFTKGDITKKKIPLELEVPSQNHVHGVYLWHQKYMKTFIESIIMFFHLETSLFLLGPHAYGKLS
jgi:hypothetical protein